MPPDDRSVDKPGADSGLPLGAWLSVFAPMYLGKMSGLIGLNVLAAIGVFVELQVLRGLTLALWGTPETVGAACTVSQWIGSGFSLEAEPCGARLPVFLLLAYTGTILVQTLVDIGAY